MYVGNQPLKKMTIEHWDKTPNLVPLYLYSINKKSDLFNEHVMVKIISEKDEKERGWLLGEVELSNCKYDAIKNCL